MKPKKIVSFFLFPLLIALLSSAAYAATIKMRVVVINPSETKAQTKSVKNFLPKEAMKKDILDTGGLELDYDDKEGALFVYKEGIELSPGETKNYEVMMNDIWMIDEAKLEQIRGQVEKLVTLFNGTPFMADADTIAQTIYGRLDDIAKTQADQVVNRQQHIAYYRDNLKILDSVLKDIERLEKMLVTAGGPPKIIKEDAKLKNPNAKTTWIIILVIMIFMAILGGSFYFTWQTQAKVAENIFKREKDTVFPEFKRKDDADKKT